MRHLFCIFLASILLLSFFTYITVFSQHALAASKIASNYITTAMLERNFYGHGYHGETIRTIAIYLPSSASGKLADARVARFQGYLSFHHLISERRSPRLPALQAEWPDGKNDRGKNNATGYELGV